MEAATQLTLVVQGMVGYARMLVLHPPTLVQRHVSVYSSSLQS